MSAKYFFSINDKQVGPLEEAVIQENISNGTINGMTMAWRQGMADWKPVSHIDELKEMLLPPPITPPPLPKEGIPEGLTPLETWAYKLVMLLYRQWGKRPVPVREYVMKNPHKALPVAFGTVVLIIAVFVIIFSIRSEPVAPPQQGMGQPGYPQQVPPAGWQAQHRAWQDAQQYNQGVIDDVYTYRRDAEDRMADVYRRGTYDFMSDDND